MLVKRWKMMYYTTNTLIWKSNSLKLWPREILVGVKYRKLENENHHGVAIAIM